MSKFLFICIETNGLPTKPYPKYDDPDKYNNCRIIHISWAKYSKNKKIISNRKFYVKPDIFKITNTQFHGITNTYCKKYGKHMKEIIDIFIQDIQNVGYVVGHCIEFIKNILASEIFRYNPENVSKFINKEMVCTAEETKYILKMEDIYGNYKIPKLSELYNFCFPDKNMNKTPVDLAECFFKIVSELEI